MSGVLRPELLVELARLYPNARHETLAGDASARRFHRLFLTTGGTRIVMDYGVPFEGETDDVRLARIFGRASIPVARVIDILPTAGALVLEDLGDQMFETSPAREKLYRDAVRLAAEIATRGTRALAESDRAAGPALDEAKFLFEMGFFLQHYVGSYLGRSGDEVREGVEALAREAASHPRVLCHRDYHSRNIMVLPRGTLALVDIQDARWGPDTYDIASLLRDAYVDLSEADVDALLELYRNQLTEPPPDRGEFRARFDIVAAQRMLKALGTFGYQVAVLGRERYRSAIPRTVSRLANLLPGNTQTASLAEELRKAGILST